MLVSTLISFQNVRWSSLVSSGSIYSQKLLCLCRLQLCICGYPIATGAAARLVSGYDSYGNTCGWNNSKIEGVPLSGQDMREKKLVQLSPFILMKHTQHAPLVSTLCDHLFSSGLSSEVT